MWTDGKFTHPMLCNTLCATITLPFADLVLLHLFINEEIVLFILPIPWNRLSKSYSNFINSLPFDVGCYKRNSFSCIYCMPRGYEKEHTFKLYLQELSRVTWNGSIAKILEKVSGEANVKVSSRHRWWKNITTATENDFNFTCLSKNIFKYNLQYCNVRICTFV